MDYRGFYDKNHKSDHHVEMVNALLLQVNQRQAIIVAINEGCRW